MCGSGIYVIYISHEDSPGSLSALADAERKLRSRIAQLVHGRWLLHGTRGAAPTRLRQAQLSLRPAVNCTPRSIWCGIAPGKGATGCSCRASWEATRAPGRSRLSTARAAARRGLRARVEAAPKTAGEE